MPQFTGNRFGFGSPNAPSGPSTEPISATGGSKTTSGDQTIHTFTGPGDFIVSSGADNCKFLIAGGGGGGGGGCPGGAGGGGAGALIYKINQPLTAQTYAVVIGEGGAVTGPGPSPSPGKGTGYHGTASTFYGLTARGGGGGRSKSADDGTYGGPTVGSGGGGNTQGPGANSGKGGGDPTTPQGAIGASTGHPGPGNADIVSPDVGWGNNGGEGKDNPGEPYQSGGGGGASQVGQENPGSASGAGGAGGTYTISGSSVIYCSGGGGGYGQESSSPTLSGAAGGSPTAGVGGRSPTNPTQHGTNASGGYGDGGGGHGYYTSGYCGTGGSGSDGVVIISYPT